MIKKLLRFVVRYSGNDETIPSNVKGLHTIYSKLQLNVFHVL